MRVVGDVRGWMNQWGNHQSIPFTVLWFNVCSVQTRKQFCTICHCVIISAFTNYGLLQFNLDVPNVTKVSATNGALFEHGSVDKSVVFYPNEEHEDVGSISIEAVQITVLQACASQKAVMCTFVYSSILQPELKIVTHAAG